MKRWQEHFAAVLNCPEPDILHEFENNTEDIMTLEVNKEAITETELAQAVSKLKNGKAAGTDHIQPELLKHAETVIPYVTKLFNTVWQRKKFLQSGKTV